MKDKIIKIVYVCSTLGRTGPINIVYNLINSDSFKGNEAVIVTLSYETEDSRKKEFEVIGVKVYSLGYSHSNKTLLSTKPLLEKLLEINPDIVHGVGFRADFLISRKAIRSRFNITSTLQNYPYDDYTMLYGKQKGRLMAKLHIGALKKMKIVSCCSDFIRNNMLKHGALNFVTVHNGVDGREFNVKSKAEKTVLRKMYNIDLDATVFIFIGYLITRKNPETLVKAFAKLDNKNTHLIVMGDGLLMDSCKAIYNEANISYIGNQPSTKEWLAMSDVYVSPSYSEGFPTAVMEALASGNLCVLSDISPHVEMVEGMADKYLFSAEDYQGCALKMSEVIGKNNYIDSRLYFDQNLSAEIMAKHHIEIYNKLIN